MPQIDWHSAALDRQLSRRAVRSVMHWHMPEPVVLGWASVPVGSLFSSNCAGIARGAAVDAPPGITGAAITHAPASCTAIAAAAKHQTR